MSEESKELSLELANSEKPNEQAKVQTLRFDLGTFEGFNFRLSSAIFGTRTAQEVVNWDHHQQGEAEFWPSGDREEVQLIFGHQNCMTGAQLLALDGLLEKLGGDSQVNFLKLHYAVNVLGFHLCDLTAELVEDEPIQIFTGDCFSDVRKAAAYELFELYFPDIFRAWEKIKCDCPIFDGDKFLDSPEFIVAEVNLGEKAVLLVGIR